MKTNRLEKSCTQCLPSWGHTRMHIDDMMPEILCVSCLCTITCNNGLVIPGRGMWQCVIPTGLHGLSSRKLFSSECYNQSIKSIKSSFVKGAGAHPQNAPCHRHSHAPRSAPVRRGRLLSTVLHR